MGTTIIGNARILTLTGPAGPRRGTVLKDLGVIDRGYVRIDGSVITEVSAGAPSSEDEPEEGDFIDAGGAVLMPAFVDCHTHACWTGSRVDEFAMSLAGASYLEILQQGGGIMSTVRAVREASEEVLAFNLIRRLAAMAALGTGTAEIKSGYGLSTEHELKMLRVIHAVTQVTPQTVVGTFLGAHAIDPANPRFIDETINETLPTVVQEFPEIVCDAYCEENAWSVKDTVRLFEAAQDLGCPLRVHADQFNSLGMTRIAVEMGAVSVDHLEVTSPEDLQLLADSSTFGVMLPSCAFHLGCKYPPGRSFIDSGGALALATNFNPGSAPSPSMPFAIALACRRMGLTPAEAITASTYNAACVLGLQEVIGSIEIGKEANLQLLDTTDERELAFEYAAPGPLIVFLAGRMTHTRAIDREGDDYDETDHDNGDEDGSEVDDDDDHYGFDADEGDRD